MITIESDVSDPPVEAALRRPDFEPGHQVVLANGQAWHFRKPRMFFEPAENSFGWTVGFSAGADPEYERIRAALDELGPRPLIRDMIGLELALAQLALRKNYELTPKQTTKLLRFAYPEMTSPDPDAVRIRDEVMAVLNGESGPKPEAGGDDSSPTSPA